MCLDGNGDALQPTSQGQGLCCKTITASQAILPLSRLQTNRATIKADPHKGELGSFLLMSGIFRSCSKNPANQWEIKKSYFLGFWNHTLISLRHLLIGNSDKQRNLLRVGYCKNLKPHLFMINWNKVFCAFIKFCFYSISYQRFDLRLETQR